jgi:hypothetical protein
MDKGRVWLLFVVIYAPLGALAYFASTPEQTGDFARIEKQFRVMAWTDGGAQPSTLAGMAKPDAGRSFLLPGRTAEVPGGDLHRATVLESRADWQLIEYEYGNTVSSVSRYRAFRDRVEPLSHRVTFHPGVLVTLTIAAVLAWLLAATVNWLWARKIKKPA